MNSVLDLVGPEDSEGPTRLATDWQSDWLPFYDSEQAEGTVVEAAGVSNKTRGTSVYDCVLLVGNPETSR
jgi:hypothetical protein